MSEQSTPPNNESPRSPLRPQRPKDFEVSDRQKQATEPTPPKFDKRYASEPETPREKLASLQNKIKAVADEFAKGEISRAQFHAIYAHYNEQRTIIERIIAHNPQNDGWKQASRSGKTSFLRNHFEARPLNYVIYTHQNQKPLMGAGSRPDMQRIAQLLRKLWRMKEPKTGVVCISLEKSQWLTMAVGEQSVTFVTFHLEPSGAQLKKIYNLHKDFEQANRIMLARGDLNKDRFVFPQRSLMENKK